MCFRLTAAATLFRRAEKLSVESKGCLAGIVLVIIEIPCQLTAMFQGRIIANMMCESVTIILSLLSNMIIPRKSGDPKTWALFGLWPSPNCRDRQLLRRNISSSMSRAPAAEAQPPLPAQLTLPLAEALCTSVQAHTDSKTTHFSQKTLQLLGSLLCVGGTEVQSRLCSGTRCSVSLKPSD